MAEYEYRILSFGREVTSSQVRRELAELAEYGQGELARSVRYLGGKRRAWLRRRIIRVQRTG